MSRSSCQSRAATPRARLKLLQNRAEADADVGVLDGTRLETLLAAGTLDPTESLDGISQAIGQNHFTLVDVFMGAVPFIARQTAGPDVVFKVNRGKEREPLGQFHVCVRGQVMVDIGRIVLELGLGASLRKPALVMVAEPRA